MDFSTVLTIHIGGAIIMAAILAATVAVLLASKSATYKPMIWLVAAITIANIATGTMLMLIQPSGVIAFCGKMAIYISLAAIAEYALIKQLKKQETITLAAKS